MTTHTHHLVRRALVVAATLAASTAHVSAAAASVGFERPSDDTPAPAASIVTADRNGVRVGLLGLTGRVRLTYMGDDVVLRWRLVGRRGRTTSWRPARGAAVVARLDTHMLPDGPYELELAVREEDGTVERESAFVVIRNAAPVHYPGDDEEEGNASAGLTQLAQDDRAVVG